VTELPFPFTEPFGDARIEELRLLSWAEQQGRLSIPPAPYGPWRDLLVALVSNELITTFSYEQGKEHYASTGHGSSPAMTSPSGIAGESLLERYTVTTRIQALDQIYQSAGGLFWLTHLGRVRRSELKQVLRSGREREPLGILWDVRHWENDLQIALIDASLQSPVSVGYMDMNGLKTLNDRDGHDAGDRGLRAYFHAVSSVLGDAGQAYRLAGDEVMAVLPGCDVASAAKRLQVACRRLMQDSENEAIHSPLSISVGIVCESSPTARPRDVRATADTLQRRAKGDSRKEDSSRPSVIAIEGVDETIVIRQNRSE
jgi:diguanylate cyclase (GGDEF)-like protein